MKKILTIAIPFLFLFTCFNVNAQNPLAQTEDGKVMITVFLKHNQELGFDQLMEKLDETGFWKEFPPPSATVVSWYTMMGIGQVVTLKIPGEKLRELNLSIEKSAWGAFFTEFYPTYDLWPVIQDIKKRQEE